LFSALGLRLPGPYAGPISRFEDISAKTAIVLLGAFIVVGGFGLALLSFIRSFTNE
jgi:hypothetical protein